MISRAISGPRSKPLLSDLNAQVYVVAGDVGAPWAMPLFTSGTNTPPGGKWYGRERREFPDL